MRRPSLHIILLIGILLIGAIARFSALQERALWVDEGITLSFKAVGLTNIVDFTIASEDANPPVYRILIGLWTELAGVSDFSARVFSGFFGLLIVALTYRIGRSLRIPIAACLLAAFIVALSPMQVYYSREVKHYIFAECTLLFEAWIALRLFPLSRAPLSVKHLLSLGAVTALCSFLAMGSHYMSLLMLIMLGIWALTWLAWSLRNSLPFPQTIRPILVWGSAQLAAGLLLLPWLLLTANSAVSAANAAGTNDEILSKSLLPYLTMMLTEFVSGPVGLESLRLISTITLVAISLVGIVFLSNKFSRLLLLIWLLIPLLLGFILQLRLPFFFPRFLLFVTPSLALLSGIALDALRQHTPPKLRLALITAASAIYLVVASFLIVGQITQPQPRPDLRALSDSLEQGFRAGDAIIFMYPWQAGILSAYLPAQQHPIYYPFFKGTAETDRLETILNQHDRVWLVTYNIAAEHPDSGIGYWLVDHTAMMSNQWYGESQLTLFASPSLIANPDTPTECVISSQTIQLCYAPFQLDAPPNSPVVINLQWQALRHIDQRYVVFVHLIGADSPVPAAQQDTQPRNGTAPTFDWQVDQPMTDLHAVMSPSEGVYKVYVGLYDADTFERVTFDTSEESIHIGQLNVISTSQP